MTEDQATNFSIAEFDKRLGRIENLALSNHLRLVILRRILVDQNMLTAGTLDRVWQEAEMMTERYLGQLPMQPELPKHIRGKLSPQELALFEDGSSEQRGRFG